MKGMEVIAAINLPPESRVDQRVLKKLLVENGAPTAADKRQINEGIEELLWLAALKPTTIGVPEYRDDVREYLEIAVLSLILRPTAKVGRLVELVHRAIPYPVVLSTEQSRLVTLSLAHKRWSLGEGGKMVLDDAVAHCELADHSALPSFLGSLKLASQPRTHLMALYQGWINCLEAFQAACITGTFVLPTNAEAASARCEALVEHDRLTRQITALRAQAERESQMSHRVELNLEIKRLESGLAEARAHL
ncbi:DUF4391 domain-containing protein [Chloroflexota bacterium]